MSIAIEAPPRRKERRRPGSCVTLYIPNDILEKLQQIEEKYGSSRSFCASRALAIWLETDGAEMLR